MGLNTPCIILNDFLHEFDEDAEIGKKIARAVRANGDERHMGFYTQAFTVLPCGHSSGMQIVAVGGNTIRAIGYGDCHDNDETLLRKLADRLGYNLTKRPAPKGGA